MRSSLKNRLQKGVKQMVRFSYPFYRLFDLFRTEEEVRVLMYHKVSNLPPEEKVPYCNVTVEAFEAQMKYLSENKIEVLTLKGLGHWLRRERLPGNRKKVVITFDDGFQDNYLNAYPILKKYNIPATFFVIVDYIGRRAFFEHLQWDAPALADREKNPNQWFPMTWEMLNEMQENGMSIGSHTCSHRSLAGLSLREVNEEVSRSKKILEEGLRTEVAAFSYPFGSPVYGDFNPTTEEALKKAGYAVACTTAWGANRMGDNPYTLKRIPVSDHDTLFDFKCKIYGGSDWVEKCKSLWQRFVRREDKVDFTPMAGGTGDTMPDERRPRAA
ncbi:MAG TPA: polysaccharide deacetylase family protein [Candidatus Manganitrophaceae bacterium]|nr:polysaccharide deacetylase family protein [Candidatus Manganitrophaceae bacterium]